MIDIEILQDNSEIVHYERADIPLYIRTGKLSTYPNMQAPCHWHDDIELIRILRGKMNYYINGKRILLKENDSIMVNARQMHYGYSEQYQDCDFICILFHPSLFTNNKVLLQNYISAVLENSQLEYVHFAGSSDYGRETAELLDRIIEMKNKADYAYEIEVIGIMHIFWSRLLQRTEALPMKNLNARQTDLSAQKNMVSYIFQHYSEKITLADIAASGHVCRSKCCSIFKYYLQQSPIDFLNAYRLKLSCNLLTNTENSITDIALSCGFNHLSYFSKIFYDTYGCTPSEYRSSQATMPD